MHLTLPDLDRYAIALSGGRDSLTLAHILRRQLPKAKGFAFHVDHGQYPESKTVAEELATWCKDEGFTYEMMAISLPNNASEEVMRKARYEALFEFCSAHNVKDLFIAHHSDDQLETILMRLCRGSGLKGLAGMRALMTRRGIRLYRPLLTITRQEITAYAKQQGLEFHDDPNNQSLKYARNKLRFALKDQGLTPRRLDRTAQRLHRADEALTTISRRAYKELVTDGRFLLSAWQGYPLEIRIRVLEQIVLALNGNPQLEKLETLAATLLELTEKQSFATMRCLFTLRDGEISVLEEQRDDRKVI